MAVPLRQTANTREAYAHPRQLPRRQPGVERQAPKPAQKRLVQRRIRSNAEFRRTVAWAFLIILSAVLLISGTVIIAKVGISQVSYNINTIRAENERLLLENDKIRGQIAELRSLHRIAEIASQELGMIKNERVEYMVLSSAFAPEGKIRPEGEKQEEGQKKASPIEAALAYLLAWHNKAR